MFGWFKSPRQKAVDLVWGMHGVSTKGMEPMSEAQEWLDELDPKDPRRQKVPESLLKADYFLISRPRSQGFVFRITETHVEIRLPFELEVTGGVRTPNSHLLRALPIRALLALGDQRAQKVLQNLSEDARQTFQDHHRTCRICFKRFAPKKYPGHPSQGILGPPASRFITCPSCEAKARAAQAAAG